MDKEEKMWRKLRLLYMKLSMVVLLRILYMLTRNTDFFKDYLKQGEEMKKVVAVIDEYNELL